MPRINIDLNFFIHPKVVSLHPLAQLLHLRALMYCARNLTDGFVPKGAIPSLVYDFGCGCDKVNNLEKVLGYSNELLVSGMWTQSDGGWLIHDYLDYQMSRKSVELHRRNRAEASVNNGKLGGRPVKPRSNLDHNLDITQNNLDHNLDITQNNLPNPNPNTNINIKNKSKSTSKDKEGPSVRLVQKPIRTGVLDEVWITELKANPLYTGIDIDCQFKKAQSWIQTNGKGRQMTRKYFGNWLVRCIGDKPMTVPVKKDWIPV